MAHDAPKCEENDLLLERWTFLRFVFIGIILLYRTYHIREEGKRQVDPPQDVPYSEHPNMTKQMNTWNIALSYVIALIFFIQSEGVGFVIYFGTSFALDNYIIFFSSHVKICEYIMQVTLYTSGCVTFLPCVAVSYMLQDQLYNRGKWLGTKPAFILIMVVSAVVSFYLRLLLVFNLGYDHLVNRWLEHNPYKVAISLMTPPFVDAVQTGLLIGVSLVGKGAVDTNSPTNSPTLLSTTKDDDGSKAYAEVAASTHSLTAVPTMESGRMP